MEQAAAGPTLVQELFKPQDFTSVLVALQGHADELSATLSAGATAEQILRSAAALPSLADKTRQTVEQILTFLPTIEGSILPHAYEAALREVDSASAPATTPAELVKALLAMREARVHESVPGFAAGVRAAADILSDAIHSAQGRALGTKSPIAVAKAGARAAVAGGMAGALSGSGPIVGAIVGGIAGSARQSMTKA